MAQKIDSDKYYQIMSQAAKKALDAKEEQDRATKKYTLQERMELYDKYRDQLMKWKPMENFEKGYEFVLRDVPSDSLLGWLEGANGYKAPDQYEGLNEASKILPLLQGVAYDGQDWYNLGTNELKKKAKALGYNTDVPGAYQEFLNLVRDYQTQFDRAQLLKEGQQGANYWLNKLFYPSSTQEAENAVLTGQGGDEETLKDLRRLDAATSLAMTLAPSLSLGRFIPPLSNSFVMGSINAGLQGAAEAARQYGTERLSDTNQKADYGQAVLALLAGGTRPAMTLGAGGAASQLPSKFGQDLARGVRKGARVGGSTERADLKDAINLYNKDLAKNVMGTLDGSKTIVPDASGGKYAKAIKVPQIAEYFDVAPDAQGKYSAKQLLNYYDANVKMPKAVEIENGKITGYNPRGWSFVLTDDAFKGLRRKLWKPTMVLGKEDAAKYREFFPEKVADIDANRLAYNLGNYGGQIVAEAGSRVEPVVGTNPFKVYDSESVQKSYTESYKRQPWYKKLNVESQKIIDEAFKKKAKEDEEE